MTGALNSMRIAVLGLRSIGGECSGGIERHVQELSTRMVERGHDVTVFCRSKYNDLGSDFVGIHLKNRPAVYSKHLEAITHTVATMPSVLFGYDIVHIHATGPSLLSWIPRLAGMATIVTVHGLDHLRAKWGGMASLVLKAGAWTSAHCPSKTIVVSNVLREHYLSKYGRQAVYIPNGIAEPTSRPLERLKRFGLESGRYILSLGRLVPEKGIHYLIKAFRSLDTDLRLAIVGEDSLSGGYLARLKELAGNDERIVFTGPLFDMDKDEAFSNAKLFCIPSDLEGMPIAMLEAMSYGCPTLSSDIQECLEVYSGQEGQIGYAFRQGDASDLSGKLNILISSGNLGHIGKSGRDFVLSEYNWDDITSKTLDVYSQACRINQSK
ncbi:glycosyltransferase family 4 protein [Pseudodesulfovibrio sp. zrk46]|uniref:glycosyltransferase family 4 protein n=1 Tax=Pseudodesulfovibrio sp. zrk46 TaxID=2725288 RepID=UPI001448A9E8|nr:glycosyltransferase family 4 protein [Pseudodesulfovibrio sp. zrk46]QJB57403.1 glycosyltransferase family 4 protein [Pseudodesulfovibrio sp. zrk46]